MSAVLALRLWVLLMYCRRNLSSYGFLGYKYSCPQHTLCCTSPLHPAFCQVATYIFYTFHTFRDLKKFFNKFHAHIFTVHGNIFSAQFTGTIMRKGAQIAFAIQLDLCLLMYGVAQREMKYQIAVILALIMSVADCQTFPYVSFMGQTLVNHSYVNLSLVGDDASGSDSVQCHSDLSTCCSGAQGSHRGDWYYPGSTDKLPFSGAGDIFEQRSDMRVDIRRRSSATSPDGIYHCDIPTSAVHDDDDSSVRDVLVYVGLYTANGGKI